MCLCRRSSGSDTWPDLLHSTRTSREQRPIRTLTHSSRPTSLQVRLQEVFTQCISQVSQAWIPLWQSCNSKKTAHCFFTCGMSSLLPHVVVQGEYTEDKKVVIFLKEKGGKRWNAPEQDHSLSWDFSLLLCFIYFIMNALWFSSESQNQRPQNIRRSRHLAMQNLTQLLSTKKST